MIGEFKTFILRGNVVELAVAVVIGAAFKGVVDSMVADLMTPLIGAFGGEPDFSSLGFTINDSRFTYGNFLNQVIAFLVIAAVIFFFVVQPLNMLIARARKEQPDDPTLKDCQFCLLAVPIGATRCSHCTSQLA